MADLGRRGSANVAGTNGERSNLSQSADPFDMRSTLAALPNGRPDTDLSAIRIRQLPYNYDHAQLRSLLTFADKLEGADFLTSSPGDPGFKTAVARFYSSSAAQQAQSILDGKQIDSDKPRLLVDILPGGIGSERQFFDHSTPRAPSGSSTGSAPRYGQYSPMNRVSPPQVNGYGNSQPPRGDHFPESRQRVSGKDVIGQDGPDEETSDLLRNPLSYATNGPSRRNNLSVNTGDPTSPPGSGYVSPPNGGLRSPVANMPNHMPGGPYQMRHPNFPRQNLPAVNPADQNPPCNTLYVGNLPIDTSEDELKAMFSKQRGYKRLCFRAKHNGPMCFVEFEDTSFAGKALNDLYGYPLHNSAHRGGIRLSFSKNPLGVRSVQQGGMGGSMSPMSPTAPFPSPNGVGMQPFSTANGPPPGIPAPPGLPMSSPGPGHAMSPTSMGFSGPPMSPGAGWGMHGPSPFPVGNGWHSGYTNTQH